MSPAESIPKQLPKSSQVRGNRVLIADQSRSRRQELARAIHDIDAAIIEVSRTSEALEYLETRTVDVIIADLNVAGAGAIELCRRVKSNSMLERTPVLIIAKATDIESEAAALDAGADGFFMGPLRARALRARVQACLRQKAMVDSLDETEKVLLTLAESVEGRDPALGLHCERLTLIAVSIGTRLGLPSSDIRALQRGGYLHDVGKVAIPDSVLLKPGPLTPEEWVIMKTHPERGEKICSSLHTLKPVLPIIRHHHEKWDGTGYPDALRGEEIPLLARILQFADIYDALTADRPYKKAFTSAQALEIMRSEVAKGWRDPHLMPVFEDVVPLFADPNSTAASLQALSDAMERFRTQPGEATGFSVDEFVPVRLVSGL